MSNYFDNKDLFLEPTTTQYGSHMVTTNVQKPLKHKLINIDTRFREDYNATLDTVNYNISLPERITDVKSIHVTNIEIPMSFYNISTSLGNNCFSVKNNSTNTTKVVVLSDAQYDLAGLQSALTSAITSSTASITGVTTTNNKCVFTTTSNITIQFSVDVSGNAKKAENKSNLGWLLGFRKPTYTFNNTTLTAESLVDLNGTRYIYLAVDEFTRGNQSSFVSPLQKSIINRNVIARIALDNKSYPYGTIKPANQMTGALVSDRRSYTGKIDILKLNIQLLDEYGRNLNLNGMDFSFCLDVIHE
jgi:hypothetical protein